MKYEELVKMGGKLPVLETRMLLSGRESSGYVKMQISRWVKAEKLIQLKRGIYLLPQTYRSIKVFEPFIANIIKKPSYLSLEKAMEFHGLIPEAVTVYTSVTTKRPGTFKSIAGTFSYRHIKTCLFWGYAPVAINKQTALIALPEKALLDCLYLKNEKITREYIEEMRLQNLEKVNLRKLKQFAKRFGKKRMIAAADLLCRHIRNNRTGEKIL